MLLNKTIKVTRNVLLCILFSLGIVHAQDKKGTSSLVTINVRNMPFSQVLELVERQISYKFAYSLDLIEKQKKVTLSVQNLPLSKLLAILFKDKGLSYSIIANQIILQKAPVSKKITISGYVKDGTTGESLAGANVYAPDLKQGANANSYSFYSLTVKEADRLDLTVSSEGYEKINVKVGARQNIVQNFNLKANKPEAKDSVKNIPEAPPVSIIQVSADTLTRNDERDTLPAKIAQLHVNINNTAKAPVVMGDTLAPKGVKTVTVVSKDSIPKCNYDFNLVFNDILRPVSSLNGDNDVLSSIQMTPGVMAGLDASSGVYVRGGNADQNQMQLDEATLYNPSHFFGLVSTFNPSAVNNGTLLKEGFQAKYGDNLSSILDISMKDGNVQQTDGELQVGTTSSGFSLNGPLVANKSSYLIAARRSTIDLWLRPLQTGNDYNNYYFYDINAKVNYQLSQNNRVFLSFYQGRDKSSYSRDTTDESPINYGVEYGNQAFAARWNHLFSQKLFSNTSVVYNKYFQSITASQNTYYAQLYSGIRDIDVKTDFNYYPNPNHKISAGINYLFQSLMPASVSDKALSPDAILSVNPSDIPQKQSFRLAFYAGDEITIGQRLQVYVGVRLPMFFNSTSQYNDFEPRFSLQYLTSTTSGIKLTYGQIHQYLHLVKSYNASFPAEIWIGSSDIVKPESSKQVSLGGFKNFKDNTFHTSIEVYYKKMDNQLLFKGELQPAITSDIENTLIFGKGESYGTELSIRKTKGKLTGLLAYALSYANQQFDSLNLGKPFPLSNDRRHCLYFNTAYALSQHWTLSSNFIFTSGRAFTIKRSVLSGTNTDGDPLYDGGDTDTNTSTADTGDGGTTSGGGTPAKVIVQNNYRLLPYSRLDLSISYKKKRQLPHRVIETEWIFSVYNVYARANTIFAYRSIDPVTKLPTVQQVSFIPVIPSITYRLTF